MYRIYSRNRINIPKFNRNNYNKEKKKKTKIEKVIIIFIILLIEYLILRAILDTIYPVFEMLCENKAKTIGTMLINQEGYNVMKKYSYEEMFYIEKDQKENIVMVKSNINLANEIISKIVTNVQEKLNNYKDEELEIRLGMFTGIKLLSGIGPKVRIGIRPIGNIEANIDSEFKEAGINQTLHKVYVNVKCKIKIITPFKNIHSEINNKVLIGENIIIGNTPMTYLNR